jgi:hypothetical protein
MKTASFTDNYQPFLLAIALEARRGPLSYGSDSMAKRSPVDFEVLSGYDDIDRASVPSGSGQGWGVSKRES